MFKLNGRVFFRTGDEWQAIAADAAGGAATGSAAGPWGAVANGIIGAVGSGISAMAGGSTTSSGLTLPPELEYQYLQEFGQQRLQLQQLFQQSQTMAQAYQERLNILSDTMSGLIPSKDALAALTNNTLTLINTSGQSAQELAKNGFLSDSDLADLQSLKDVESADFKDPAFEAARQKQRVELVMGLKRNGASEMEIKQRLSQFDMDSTIGSFQAAQQLKLNQSQLITNRLGVTQNLRQTNFGITQGTISQQLGAGGQFAGYIGNKVGIDQAGYQIGATGIQQQQGLMQQQNQNYTTAGGFKFSKTAKRLINEGRVDGIGALPIYGKDAGGRVGTQFGGKDERWLQNQWVGYGDGEAKRELENRGIKPKDRVVRPIM